MAGSVIQATGMGELEDDPKMGNKSETTNSIQSVDSRVRFDQALHWASEIPSSAQSVVSSCGHYCDVRI